MTFDNFPLDVQVFFLYWILFAKKCKLMSLYFNKGGKYVFWLLRSKVCRFQVGSFNYDITKIVFKDEFVAESSAIK